MTDQEQRLRELVTRASLPWHAGHLLNDDMECSCPYIFDEGHAGGVGEVYIDNGLMISDGGNDAPKIEDAKVNLELIVSGINYLPELFKELDQLRLQVNRK